jgi:hypothetical protein
MPNMVMVSGSGIVRAAKAENEDRDNNIIEINLFISSPLNLRF